MSVTIAKHPQSIAEIGALIGDPGRARMLDALMDGRSLTARELAAYAGLAPQTASGHLARMLDGGLLAMQQCGRHRYHRLASAEVARLLETIGNFVGRADGAAVRTGPRDAAMRLARTCYDHFAGRLGVGLADALVAAGHVELDHEGGALTRSGEAFLCEFGVAIEDRRDRARLFCRPCLDWSERRPNLAGFVGTALACRCFELGWVRRVEGSRALTITVAGRQGLRRWFSFCI